MTNDPLGIECPECLGTTVVADTYEPSVNAWNSRDCACTTRTCGNYDCARLVIPGYRLCPLHHHTRLAQLRLRRAG